MGDNEKYKKAMPVLLRICNLISVHPTDIFSGYMEELKAVETRIRKGRSIFDDFDTSAHQDNSGNNDLKIEEDGKDVKESHGQEIHEPDDEEYLTVQYTNEILDDGQADELNNNDDIDNSLSDLKDSSAQESKFKYLKMLECTKTKGRPKRKRKQLTFNKTICDRKEQPIKKKKVKVKQTKFLDDSANDTKTEPEMELEESETSRILLGRGSCNFLEDFESDPDEEITFKK